MALRKPTPIRLSDDLHREITEAAAATRLTFADTMRQAMTLGIPELKKRLNGAPKKK